MVQFDSPWHLKSSVSSSFKVGWIPFSHYWPSGVIRIGLPSMKVKKFETFQNKRGSACCKWPNLNTPGTQTPQYHPIPELTKPNLTSQMQGWVFGKWNFSEQRWSGAIFYRAQCRDRRRFPRIWFLNCKKSSWHLTPLSFLSWFGPFVYSKKRKASDPASQPKASQIQKVPILKHSHDIFLSVFWLQYLG